MAELVDAVDLKFTAFWRAGSSPAGGTRLMIQRLGGEIGKHATLRW